jgi:6-phosphogluconolactonase
MRVESCADDRLVVTVADWFAERIRRGISLNGSFTLAVSGGTTRVAVFAELAGRDLPWSRLRVFQVDERIAPEGDPDRNLTALRRVWFDRTPVSWTAMSVPDPGASVAERSAAADRYAALLPDRLDLVHLGLGADGHCASLVPGDPVLDVADRRVAATARPYQGRRRLTLTFPALNAAKEVVWLVSGDSKRDALERLLAGDRSIPAGRVEQSRATVLCDLAARARSD